MSQINRLNARLDSDGDSSVYESKTGNYIRYTDHLASHAYDDAKERALANKFIEAQQLRLAKGGHSPLTGIEESAMRGAWLACAKSRAKAAGCL